MSVGVVERIFEAMEEGLVLIEPDGRITHANPAAERILGLTKSEIEAPASPPSPQPLQVSRWL